MGTFRKRRPRPVTLIDMVPAPCSRVHIATLTAHRVGAFWLKSLRSKHLVNLQRALTSEWIAAQTWSRGHASNKRNPVVGEPIEEDLYQSNPLDRHRSKPAFPFVHIQQLSRDQYVQSPASLVKQRGDHRAIRFCRRSCTEDISGHQSKRINEAQWIRIDVRVRVQSAFKSDRIRLQYLPVAGS